MKRMCHLLSHSNTCNDPFAEAKKKEKKPTLRVQKCVSVCKHAKLEVDTETETHKNYNVPHLSDPKQSTQYIMNLYEHNLILGNKLRSLAYTKTQIPKIDSNQNLRKTQ